MKHLTTYLIKANEHLEKARKKATAEKKGIGVFTSEGKVQGEYPPFAASLGATILRSGLLPAIFLYAEQSGAGKSKDPLNELILDMIREEGDESKSLKEYILKKNRTEPDRLKKQVLDASIAAKLALRTYPVEGKTKELQSNN